MAAEHHMPALMVTACNPLARPAGKTAVPVVHALSDVDIIQRDQALLLFLPWYWFWSGTVAYSQKGWRLALPSGEEVELN